MKKQCPSGRNSPPCKDNQEIKIRNYKDKTYTECCYDIKKKTKKNTVSNKDKILNIKKNGNNHNKLLISYEELDAWDIDNNGKKHKSKSIKKGKCIPFNFKKKLQTKPINGKNGPWCATSTDNNGKLITWGYVKNGYNNKNENKEKLNENKEKLNISLISNKSKKKCPPSKPDPPCKEGYYEKEKIYSNNSKSLCCYKKKDTFILDF